MSNNYTPNQSSKGDTDKPLTADELRDIDVLLEEWELTPYGRQLFDRLLSMARSSLAGEVPAGEPEPRLMDTAPKDGSFVRLLVDYSEEEADHPLEDQEVAWTFGFNNLSNTGEDRWQFVGWSWQQDKFCDGKGEVIGWLPLSSAPDALSEETKCFECDTDLHAAFCPACNPEMVGGAGQELVEAAKEVSRLAARVGQFPRFETLRAANARLRTAIANMQGAGR